MSQNESSDIVNTILNLLEKLSLLIKMCGKRVDIHTELIEIHEERIQKLEEQLEKRKGW